MTRTMIVSIGAALLLLGGGCGDDDGSVNQPDAFVQMDSSPFTCGNGVLEPGEECDDGNISNNDDCSSECEWTSVCGDGVQAGPEECDGDDGLPTCVQLGELDGTTTCDASCNVVADCQDDSDDLVAWYKLDGMSGVVVDETNNGNGCTVYGNVQRGLPGMIDSAFGFDGVDAYANCGAGVQMDNMDGLTLEVWVNMTAFSDEGMFISRAESLDASELSYFMGVAGGTRWGANQYHFMFAVSDSTNIAFTGQLIPTDEWHHVAGTYQNGELLIYLDGVLSGAAFQPHTGPVVAPTNALTYIGSLYDAPGTSGWSTFFAGFLDDIKVWKVARTADEVCADAGGNPDGSGGCSIPDLN